MVRSLTQFGHVTYSYDSHYNVSQKKNVSNEETTSYTYDHFGNLKSVVLPGGDRVDYVVDARNRRVGRKKNGTYTSKYLYLDQLNPVAELDENNNLVSLFVYGSKSHVPDYMIKSGVKYRIISDQLGSVRFVINTNNGTTAQEISYNEWGMVLSDSNPGLQPFGYAGGIYDSDTKLVRFGARDYDASVGRWTAKDPILFAGADSNLYRYVGNDPLNFVDIEGQKKKRPNPIGPPNFFTDIPLLYFWCRVGIKTACTVFDGSFGPFPEGGTSNEPVRCTEPVVLPPELNIPIEDKKFSSSMMREG